jgi:hypothetical protein
MRRKRTGILEKRKNGNKEVARSGRKGEKMEEEREWEEEDR